MRATSRCGDRRAPRRAAMRPGRARPAMLPRTLPLCSAGAVVANQGAAIIPDQIVPATIIEELLAPVGQLAHLLGRADRDADLPRSALEIHTLPGRDPVAA